MPIEILACDRELFTIHPSRVNKFSVHSSDRRVRCSASMSYDQLLRATIDHLRRLKSDGARFIFVSPESWRVLTALSPMPTAPVAGARREQSAFTPESAVPVPVTTSSSARTPTPIALDLPNAGVSAAPPNAVPLSREAKETALAELRARAMVCQKCPHLAASRTNVAFGVGDIHSPLMFVGEAPGVEEDQQGEPFVGKAGQLLTRIIRTMGFTRNTVYIANILKCRPDTPGQAFGNRKPTPEEMRTCLPYLVAQIDLIRPQVVVALGATAVEGLVGKTAGITRIRGQWLTFRDIPVMPTYHPAYLLRNNSLGEKRKVWEDMLQVLQSLGRPISQKQRDFFRTG